jgi:predicted AlkP superfamily pyrophosphatase or phosphodiesterase
MVYLPHLDYAHQKYGPDAPESDAAAAEIDGVVGRLLDRYERDGVRVIVVSEYGIEPVDDAVHVNRHLREAGLLRVRVEDGLELLDAGASRAFAVADHQVAHVYVRDVADAIAVRGACEGMEGVESVLDRSAQREVGIDHERGGELVLVSEARRWFSYYYWLNDRRAPDFARCVEIHRKPGYDPVELFIDPAINAKWAIASRLVKKKLGFRTLMDVIPLDASLVRGSHGRVTSDKARMPVMLGAGDGEMGCAGVRDVILEKLFSADGE